ncbi:hypothetical protein PVAND_000997 [Polypedilum vanderplanki]|uniref:Phospholipase A2-like central domain-containing protein n=1 Tax=Polypedilum vanderplanki TaxID=319348 RepID=A0A9J6BLL5_POLVA|nr:hypothetical protein PVAND_000997 [Polypedilum vanderplanki]
MEKKFTIKYLAFLWIISISTTHCALKLQITSPIHIVKNFNLPQRHATLHHKSPNEMKLHIKKVLNMHTENATLDHFITKMFNIQNLNPTYVFRLPGKNRILTFRKSDFSIAIFPNITNINKFSKNNQMLHSSSSTNHHVKTKSEENLDELKHERLIFQKNLNGNYDDADYDENMKKIVEENGRQEREFIEFLNELNEDLNEENLTRNINAQKLTNQVKKNSKKKDEWEELGLDGWSGMMVKSKEELPKKERNKQQKKIVATALVPFLHNFDPFSILKSQPTATKIKTSVNRPQMTSHEIETEEFNNQLSILLEDEKILLNRTGRLPNVRWPVTSNRNQHNDEDIYIARANNPFGHSTKWKYRNSSDDNSHREGRSKRGVVHLYSMIKCATSCDPLQYKGYGCYCGFLGSGRALDGIDRCCKAHDYCYGNANCFFYTEYLVPYLWKCYRGKPLCALDNGEWGGVNSCATKLCECDRALSKCLRQYYCPRKRAVCSSNPFRLLQNLVMVF